MTAERLAALEVSTIAQEILQHRYIPSATYRLQFQGQFTFRDAQGLISYLHDLGISDIYAAPILKPREGSQHGYDITDHGQLNPALGTSEDFDALIDTLQQYEMGLVLDMVPNHMGIDDPGNSWWMDVLENGPSSVYANYFDIDWAPVKPELRNKVLLPVLGDQYGNVLERGELQLTYQDGVFWLYYYEHVFPISPCSYKYILGHKQGELSGQLGEDHEYVLEWASIMTAIGYLPGRDVVEPEKVAERNREKEVIKRRIDSLYQESTHVRDLIDSSVQHFNGVAGEPQSFDLLDMLISDQAYRLSYWRVATEEINYRRFFDINDLAAIRVEEPEVFLAVHDLIIALLASGKARGLRIDHPDGLWDPADYFGRLQITYIARCIAQRLVAESTDEEPLTDEELDKVTQEVTRWFTQQTRKQGYRPEQLPLYVVVEKILSDREKLPTDWAVHGTTGYDFLHKLTGIFVDRNNQSAFNKLYSTFIGREIHFEDLVNRCKKMIMLVSLAGQVNEISHQLESIAEKNRKYRDFTLNGLTFALREVIAGLPVYRTYITGPKGIDRQDRQHVRAAVREARRRNPRTAVSVFEFLHDTLVLDNIKTFRKEDHEQVTEVVMEMQQLTSPVMAKGLEDTAFYVYARLVSLNEVGGHPEHFGTLMSDFHNDNLERLQRHPQSMLTSSTHDTKRSEDVRARINVLSEMPNEWRAVINRWARMNAARKTAVDGMQAPDRNDEYMFYQNLIGVWNEEVPGTPEFAQFRSRVARYMEKATREAKVHTSWVNPNEEYDTAMQQFVERVLDDSGRNNFLKDAAAFRRHIAFFGRLNSLAQTLIKLTAPGVPDIYQGADLWDYSLVDPDNRRPVDYQLRAWLLSQLKRRVLQADGNLVPLARELLDDSLDGRVKLYLIFRTLNFRRDNAELFLTGDYRPLEAVGERQEHVCVFARLLPDAQKEGVGEMVVVVPRLVYGLTGGTEQMPLGSKIWQDTQILLPHAAAGQAYRNLFTGEVIRVEREEGAEAGVLALATIFAHFPAVLLVRE